MSADWAGSPLRPRAPAASSSKRTLEGTAPMAATGRYRAMMGPVSRPVPREVSVDIHGAVKHTEDVDGLVWLDQVRDAVGTARENADLAACAICQRR